MKTVFTILLPLFLLSTLNAQRVGIGTNTPDNSAALEISSSNKGVLLPRLTTAQRNAIAGAATGLLVYDSDLKNLYQYNGLGWVAVGGAAGFSLPYSQTVNTGIPAFQVINQGAGPAIEGSSSNEFGYGITAKTTGDYGYGLFAVSNKPGARSIFAYADSGAVFHGENNYSGNTNNLAYLLNRGAGKTLAVQLSNASSTAANMQIAGNNLGEQLLIFQTNAANTRAAVAITNSGTGAGLAAVANNGTGLTATSTTGAGVIATSTSNIGLSGTSSSNYGVKGVTNTSQGFAGVYGQNTGTAGSGVVGTSDAVNTQGVYGSSVNGIGVRAASGNYRAVQATSTTGTALFGSSTSSYGLEVSGNVKISGGNTNPAAGYVLTSDASGNATWQNKTPPKVAFKATGVGDAHPLNIILGGPYGSPVKLEFKNEQYDFGGNYNLYAGTVGSTSSCFITPMNGVYHFDAAITFIEALIIPYTSITVYVKLSRNGTVSTISKGTNEISDTENIFAQTSTDVFLFAGDRIWVEVEQWNATTVGSPLEDKPETVFFNGHLVFAQ